MNMRIALASIVVTGFVCGVAGIGIGARMANGNHARLNWEKRAISAGSMAEVLSMVRSGYTEMPVVYLERGLDTAFANFAHETGVPSLSQSGRQALRRAAEYRRQVPWAHVNPDWDARVQRGLDLAR